MNKQTEILGLKIAYSIFSPDKNSKRTLVFLHGWGGTKESWEKNITVLSKSFDCIAIDLPGFGECQTPDKIWGTFEYASFLKEFLDKLHIHSPVLIGKSFGGRVAIVFASKWPNSVKRLILISAAGIEEKSLHLRIQIEIAKVFKNLLSLVPGLDVEAVRRVYYQRRNIKEESKYKREVKKIVTNQDLQDRLSAISTPTLIVWGSNDQVLPVQYAERLQSGIKNSSLKIIQDGDHWVHQNKSDEFNRIVVDFV